MAQKCNQRGEADPDRAVANAVLLFDLSAENDPQLVAELQLLAAGRVGALALIQKLWRKSATLLEAVEALRALDPRSASSRVRLRLVVDNTRF